MHRPDFAGNARVVLPKIGLDFFFRVSARQPGLERGRVNLLRQVGESPRELFHQGVDSQ